MNRIFASPVVFGGVLAVALAGCDRGSGQAPVAPQSPTTTSVSSPVSSGSTKASPSVTPINDKDELCHKVRSTSRDLTNAIESLWRLLTREGGHWDDPNVVTALSKVQKADEETFPQLEGIVGQNAPQDVAAAVQDFLSVSRSTAHALEDNASKEELDPLGIKFDDAKTALSKACSD